MAITISLTITIDTDASAGSQTFRFEASPTLVEQTTEAGPGISAAPRSPVEEPGPSAQAEQAAPATGMTKSAIIRREFLDARRADANRPVAEIAREIALRHNWSVTSTSAQIYAQKLTQAQGGDADADKASAPEPARRKRVGAPSEVLTLQELYHATPEHLAIGNIAWDVRANDAPETWKLDYMHGAFPYPARSIIAYQKELYRVVHVWNDALDVASIEVEGYEVA